MAKSARQKQLDTLLRIRRLEEDLAKAALASANEATRAAQVRLESARELYTRTVVPPAEAQLSDFRRHLAMANSAAGMVRGAEHRREEATEAAEEARGKVLVARVKSQGLERLVERVEAARFAEMLAADQRTAEESRAGNRTKGSR
mgnify:CR=1 FL=1